jgi:alpha-1,2-mannosyltransferase
VFFGLQGLRTGSPLTEERLRIWPAAFLIGFVIAIILLFATAHGNMDYHGRPIGTDFSNVYAAGKFALAGKPTAPFDPARQYPEEQSLFGKATQFYGWHYPPYFLLLAAPLALLPYLAALALYQLATLALYVGSMWLLLRKSASPSLASDPRWILVALAFPAAFVNLTHGNNGFLTAALLASGLALLETWPAFAGVLFGLLVYKPQFVMLIPLALAFGGYWRAIIAGALTIIVLSVLTTIAFGPDVWTAFLQSLHFARTVVLEQGATGFNKIQSVFAMTRLWGGSIALAYAAQAVATALVAAALAWLWRANVSFADRGAFLSVATILATPYCLDYDLVSLAPAIALLAAQGLARGFRDHEKALLALLWIMPIFARPAGGYLFFPLGPLSMLVFAAWLAKTALRPNPDGSVKWSEREDSNLRPPRPERGALPG